MAKTAFEQARDSGNKHIKEIYSIIEAKTKNLQYTADGIPTSGVAHTADEIATITNELHSMVLDNYPVHQRLDDMAKSVTMDLQRASQQMIKDGFYNPVNKIGTLQDPSMGTSADMPLLIAPQEGANIYANGGIAANIIDKKSKGALLNGYSLLSGLFTAQELKTLQEYADSLGFSEAVTDAIRDGLLFGGSITFPILVGDNPLSDAMSAPQLFSTGKLHQNCVKRFVEIDRWNCVTVPNYDFCAEDYLNPRSLYIPISGREMHSDRIMFCKPKPQPYWSAIMQLGWGTSDLSSFMRALFGYEVMAMSLPIMCQQMSLLVHQLPLDGIIAQNGPTAAKKWQKENEAQLRDWSILNPKAINSYGELTVLNRTYTGFKDLVDSIRKDVSAKSGLPESVLFFTQPEGIFNDNKQDTLLKQTETIQLIQRTVAKETAKLLPYIATSLWGLPEGWSSWEKYQSLRISFDTPAVATPADKADIAYKTAQAVQLLASVGWHPQQAMSLVTKIIGEVDLPTDFEQAVTDIPDTTPELTNGTTGNPEGNASGMVLVA